MTENPKRKCFYCNDSIFCSKLGDHLLSRHESEIFESNLMRKKLLCKENYNNPITTTFDNSVYHLCLCCNKVVSNIKFANKHFQDDKCKKLVREKMDQLSQKYPYQDKPKIDLSGAIIGNNNTIINLSYSNENAEVIKDLIRDLMRVANVNRKDAYLQELKLAKAKKRGILTEEQLQEIEELSDDSDDDLVFKPDNVQEERHIRKLLIKIPSLDPTR